MKDLPYSTLTFKTAFMTNERSALFHTPMLKLYAKV